MKICTIEIETVLGPQLRLGILMYDQSVLDVQNVWKNIFYEQNPYYHQQKTLAYCPSSLYEILNLKSDPIEFFKETIEHSEKFSNDTRFPIKLSTFSWKSPLDRISLYRDFYAHEKHVAKGFEKRGEAIPEAWYEMPVYYKGSHLNFIGHEEEVIWPSYTKVLDYELELGIVIGKYGKNIVAKDAQKHIFGYTILNDISARDIQKKEMAVRLGPAKGKDFCSVMGPVIVTADEFNFKEPNLQMEAKINGELWSSGQSSDAKFSFSEMIEHASKEEAIVPAEFMGSGTVGTGCGLELDKWIQPGDEVELFIENIGKLRNTIQKR